MLRWLTLLLLILNLGLFVWGWTHDQPMDPPVPPMAEAPREIRLRAPDQPPVVPAAVRPRPDSASTGAPAAVGASPNAAGTDPARTAADGIGDRGTAADPVSAYDRGGAGGLSRVPLPETLTERVDPGLLPDELDAEPPLVIPPVLETDPGTTHTWSRE